MPADLTCDPLGPSAATYGLVCEDHPDATRRGLTQAHATNAVAKHNRDHHEDGPAADLANITAAALAAWEMRAPAPEDASPLQRAQALAVDAAALQIMEALTGLSGQAAIDLTAQWAYARPAITAHVAPF